MLILKGIPLLKAIFEKTKAVKKFWYLSISSEEESRNRLFLVSETTSVNT